MPRRAALTSVLVGLSLMTGVGHALGDVIPEEELWGAAIGASVTIAGVDQFPEHVFYVFPAYCTTALAALDGASLYFYDQDEFADRPNYLVLRDGPLASWIGGNQACQASSIYALARDVAATIDLDAMPLEGLRDLFEADARLFRADSSLRLLDTPLYADKGSPLRRVDEVLRVLRLDAEDGIKVVVDSDTYSFADGTTQTLPLAHTKRPPLPFRPLKPEKIAKYVETHAKWLARQPATPPPAPRLPAFAEAGPPAGSETTMAGEGTGHGAGTTAASTATGASEEATAASPEAIWRGESAAVAPAAGATGASAGAPADQAAPSRDRSDISPRERHDSGAWAIGGAAGLAALAAALAVAASRRRPRA